MDLPIQVAAVAVMAAVAVAVMAVLAVLAVLALCMLRVLRARLSIRALCLIFFVLYQSSACDKKSSLHFYI